jgi:hypothetical protein
VLSRFAGRGGSFIAARGPRAGQTEGSIMAGVQVRYIVNDGDTSIRFYCDRLGFKEIMHPAPAFAMLERGELPSFSARRTARLAAGSRCPSA